MIGNGRVLVVLPVMPRFMRGENRALQSGQDKALRIGSGSDSAQLLCLR